MCNNAIKSLSDFVTNNRILDDNKVDNYNQTVNRHIPVSKDNIQQNHANFKNFLCCLHKIYDCFLGINSASHIDKKLSVQILLIFKSIGWTD